MDTTQLLQNAIENKARLKVIYHGGSMPGQLREIGPISVKNGKTRAKCYTSDAVKTFVIDKMQVMDNDGSLSEEKQRDPIYPKFDSVEQLADFCKEQLDQTKYHINFDTEHLSIHKKFKNGNPQKGHVLAIVYEEDGSEMIYDERVQDFVFRKFKKQKSWMILGKNITTVSYVYFNKATDKFIEQLAKL